MRAFISLAATAVLVVAFSADHAFGHQSRIAMGGQKVVIKTSKGPAKRKFVLKTAKGLVFTPADPAANGSYLLVRGIGPDPGKTGVIDLDASLWKGLGNPAGTKGYKYKDKNGTRGGVRKIVFRAGRMKIAAKGPNWSWDVAGPQVSVWMHFRVGEEGGDENEAYCTHFGEDSAMKNEAGLFKAKKAPKLSTCPEEVCGNGVLELGEECDDGNLEDLDGCTVDCVVGQCTGQEYATTMEAIQAVIFDSPAYNCTDSLCHDSIAPQGQLDLTAGASHANLVNVPAAGSGAMLDRVEPGDKDLSFLYEKVAAGTLGTEPNGGSSMPSGGGPPLTEDHLEALRLWIQGGAPADGVVAGTAELLAGCLPDPTPLKLPVPDPPGAGVGVQLQSTPWPLPSHFENEVCFATYYDLTATNLVPASAIVPCPNVCSNNPLQPCNDSSDCGGEDCVAGSANNPSGQCFRIHKQALLQDPQSHHAFVRAYLGAFDTTDEGWGSWTYKLVDDGEPLHGQSCDPTDVDPATGYNPGCSSEVQEAVACLGAGPADLSNNPGQGLAGSSTAPTFTGSGVPVFEQEFADGVYSVLPMQGILVWNSHAFNLTNFDTTMSLYLNLFVADPADQQYQVQPIFDAPAIFVQDVPPFQTVEYCRTWTAPQGTRIFLLTSHTHQWGIQWRTWGPPNTPCTAPGNTSCGTPRTDAPLYLSTEYSDPLNLFFDGPDLIALDDPDPAERTFLYCSVYDNGSTPESPPVKQQSTSVEPPLVFGVPVGPGGPCNDATVACLNGPNRGMLCGGDDSICDTFPDAGDGLCDACPVRGGVTTTDEMFILQGAYYVVDLP